MFYSLSNTFIGNIVGLYSLLAHLYTRLIMELIVFDLDGTLLNEKSEISAFTQTVLAQLRERNIAYTLATGRPIYSARRAIAEVPFLLPQVFNNGSVLFDPAAKQTLLNPSLTEEQTNRIANAAKQLGVAPFVSTLNHQQEIVIFYPEVHHHAEKSQLLRYQNESMIQLRPLNTLNNEYCITNIFAIGESETVLNFEHAIKAEPGIVSYSGLAFEDNSLRWMDINHCEATKASAIRRVQAHVGATKLICFGDSDNDLSLFSISDECYAPENAKSLVKEKATEVIGHHNEEGIAHFLMARFHLSCV